ncbi:hypothetical protein Pcar_2615 [Syntrophotalea carbinolica DSM 2380]|uniref:Uncharacterized protein n=1 Tax=Syntrophotalea carbinolica (strain DSM 2380 / NBRC 103641 / GraBd1) TaxID=338963 RepID=Q3A1A4_SYNC1|nr:MYG1 family protein [Syntrophotalea carbinolica]ABA89853.1 hypothetical protein Pcar_2615 [Syntrophotalea carbinolica DSM 2380]
MHKIVVHPGNAHRDDFLAVSILLAILDEAEVFRRDPGREDLADPGTYVVDVGMEYDPERRNFDHHQDKSLPCAFHLVMQDLGYHEDAQAVFGWYPFMSMMDVRGPHKTAEHLGVDASVLLASSSPIDGYILSRFSRLETLRSQDLLYQFMREMGRDMLALIKLKKERLERLRREAEIVPVKQLKAVVCAIEDNPKLSMELYLRSLEDARVMICITPSVRGEGWELLRLGDSNLVDFRAIADRPQIRFVHANGYIATTRTLLPLAEVLELAARSVADGEEHIPM